MPADVTIPRLGWSMEEGIFVRWLKGEGEWVNRGDQLFLLESEKATQEIESIDEGYLRIPPNAPQPGDAVKVGQVIALLLAAGEKEHVERMSPPVGNPSIAATPPAGPAARRLARQLNVALDGVAGTGPGGRITAGDIHAQAARREAGNGMTDRARAGMDHGDVLPSPTMPGGDGQRDACKIAITPRARRVARELDIDPSDLTGSGRSGRIRERDVIAKAAQSRRQSIEARPLEVPAGRPTKLGTVRRTIARRMVASHQTTAPVTLTAKVDATNLASVRKQFQATATSEQEIVPSISDLVVKLVAIALERHPRLNARWEEEHVVELAEIRVGIAVDTEAGLLVPVLPDVRLLGVREIAVRARELTSRARAGQLSTAELQGGTFTVTNLGMYGIDAFTPIINPPEAAILGLGAIHREPVFVEGDRVVPCDMMTLSLTFDHRIVDGAPAARFLQTLRTGIENPAAWLTA